MQDIQSIIKDSLSYREVMRKMGINVNSGHQYSLYKKKIIQTGCDLSHFKGKSSNIGCRKKGGLAKKHWRQILICRKTKDREYSKTLRKAFKEYCIDNKINYECNICKNNGNWFNSTLKLEISHKDDVNYNNIPSNLEWLCPNCHSIK